MHPALTWILVRLQQRGAAPGTLASYLVLLSFAAQESEGEPCCQASAARIAAAARLGPRRVQLVRAQMEDWKWIRVERTRAPNRGPLEANPYHILDHPPGWRGAEPGTLHPALTWLLVQLREGEWSSSTALVYLYLLAFAVVIEGHRPHCHRSLQQIGDGTGLSRSGVRLAVTDLQDRGVVEVRGRRGGTGRQAANIHYIKQFPPAWQVPYRQPAAPGEYREAELQEIDALYVRPDDLLSRSAATVRQSDRARDEHHKPERIC